MLDETMYQFTIYNSWQMLTGLLLYTRELADKTLLTCSKEILYEKFIVVLK